jgi:hypothetical protein
LVGCDRLNDRTAGCKRGSYVAFLLVGGACQFPLIRN